MKKLRFILISISVILLSCRPEKTSETPTQTTQNKTSQPTKNCKLSIDHKTSNLEWIAFKTTSKVPVVGVFSDFRLLTDKKIMRNVEDLIRATRFSISSSSVNSGNEIRDKNIIDFFFATIKNKSNISGVVKNLSKKMITFEITFNGLKREVDFAYEYEDNFLKITGTIDLDDFKASKAISSLNAQCNGKHQGEDGISKTWSEIEISFTTNILTNCN